MTRSRWTQVLKTACQMSGSRWAVRLFYDDETWHLLDAYGMRAAARRDLSARLDDEALQGWLNAALASGRPRARRWEGERWHVFPCAEGLSLFLVGPETLSAEGRRTWHLLAKTCTAAAADLGLAGRLLDLSSRPALGLIEPSQVEQTLRQVLDAVIGMIGAGGGWLGAFSASGLDIRVASGLEALPFEVIPVEENALLYALQTGAAMLVLPARQIAESGLPFATCGDGLLMPLLAGRRAIGVLAFWRETPFDASARSFLRSIVPYIELVFSSLQMLGDLSWYTRRLGLLNDFIRTVSLASSLDESIVRVFALLKRTFGTSLVALALFSADGMTLRLYKQGRKKVSMVTQDVAHSALAQAVRRGQPLRQSRIDKGDACPRIYSEARSRLVVPLRQRGEVIGAIFMESAFPDAFSESDGNLLAVIASHLNGVVAYGRLLEHAEAHARRMEWLHHVVQRLIGRTDLKDVARITADFLAQSFAYDVVVVALQSENAPAPDLWASGNVAASHQDVFLQKFSVSKGLCGRACREHTTQFSNNVQAEDEVCTLPHWSPRSALCTPVILDGRVVGAVYILDGAASAFSSGDVLVLEALSGVLSGVVALAWQYQRLHETVYVLQETKQELQARIQAQLAAENKFLQAAKLAAVGEMAAGVAHELNNPLTTVIGFTELVLGETDLPDEVRHDLDMVLKEARRARAVVRRLLDFSRQNEALYVRSDLNLVIEETLALMMHLLKTRGIYLRQDLSDELPWVRMDPNQMKQVFLNLFHNAVQAMPNGGELRIGTRVQSREMEDWVTVTVQDTGHGMSQEVLGRIFEPFFTTHGDHGGTGLGLSVTYGIIAEHHGKIEVQSEPGAGTVFTIWLPCCDEGMGGKAL